jgi:hypothetical protein
MEKWETAFNDLLPVFEQNTLPAERPSSFEAFRQWLIITIERLIARDFEALMFLLYRIDVNEKTVKASLAASKGENAAGIIADLIIERQLKKIEWREKFRQAAPPPEDEEERW